MTIVFETKRLVMTNRPMQHEFTDEQREKGRQKRRENGWMARLTPLQRENLGRTAAFSRWYNPNATGEARLIIKLRQLAGIAGEALANGDHDKALQALHEMRGHEQDRFTLQWKGMTAQPAALEVNLPANRESLDELNPEELKKIASQLPIYKKPVGRQKGVRGTPPGPPIIKQKEAMKARLKEEAEKAAERRTDEDGDK